MFRGSVNQNGFQFFRLILLLNQSEVHRAADEVYLGWGHSLGIEYSAGVTQNSTKTTTRGFLASKL